MKVLLIDAWLKKAWQDKTFRSMTKYVLGGSTLFQIATYITAHLRGEHAGLPEAFIFGWGMYFFVYLPITYYNRNTR